MCTGRLNFDQLAAHVGGRKPAIPPRGLKDRVGPTVVLDDDQYVVEQVGQMDFGRLTSPAVADKKSDPCN